MKLKTMAVAAGVGVPLILAAPSDAGFRGIHVVHQPNAYNLVTMSVYADFDNPGNDWMLSVAGTPASPMHLFFISEGEFYNNQFGSDQAPVAALVGVFPSLAFDSFYTIGLKVLPAGQEDFLNLVNLPPLAGSEIFVTNGSWELAPPTAAQGNPFDPINCFPGNGSVLIGQFSKLLGAWPYGTTGQFLVRYISDGVVGQTYVGFGDCTSQIHCDDGDPCNGVGWCLEAYYECYPGIPWPDCNDNWLLDSCDIDNGTSPDCNENGIPDECDLDDGTSLDCNGNGIPDECECLGDLNGDGAVTVQDFLDLLSDWGPCPGCPADIDNDGTVGAQDFLLLLARWGPCPNP